jgi:hypothetical protein
MDDNITTISVDPICHQWTPPVILSLLFFFFFILYEPYLLLQPPVNGEQSRWGIGAPSAGRGRAGFAGRRTRSSTDRSARAIRGQAPGGSTRGPTPVSSTWPALWLGAQASWVSSAAAARVRMCAPSPPLESTSWPLEF